MIFLVCVGIIVCLCRDNYTFGALSCYSVVRGRLIRESSNFEPLVNDCVSHIVRGIASVGMLS